ncbi:MAG: hypothetical protein JW963_04885 [Anaerolineales bacterium]|nr:hypothetical protein [Anaerolineales bacterium]
MSTFEQDYRKLLQEELELMEQLKAESSRFDFSVLNSPPTHYEVTFRCKGLEDVIDGIPQFRNEHKAEIILHPNYPLAEDSFEIQWKTPILHPNIDIEMGPCVKGTPLGANIRIAYLCEFIADMIQFTSTQHYRLENMWKTDRSRRAASWVRDHPDAIPLDTTPLRDRGVQQE